MQPPPADRRRRQTLIFDADDTLWENNVLFERVIEDYLDWLAHPTLDRAEIRSLLNEIEAANIVAHGYGSRVFLKSLADLFERLSERPASDDEASALDALAARFVLGQVELIPGVAQTLAELGERHDLYLMTKGDEEEQQRKVDASALAHYFRTVHIVREKDVHAYRALVLEHELVPERTWMIGNSPKSDILPARQAGLNAVFIPNTNTWALEHDVLDPDDERVLEVQGFRDLLRYF